jgi:hypothetical protein
VIARAWFDREQPGLARVPRVADAGPVAPVVGAVEPAIRTTFERFEVKYWVTESIAARIAEFARPYLELDPHGKLGAKTRNVSLYLDTRGLLFLENHVAGLPDRTKLRVRAYGDLPTGLAFFEIKRKVKSITLKKRATLPVTAVRDVLTGRHVPVPARAEEQPHLLDFVFLQRIHRAEPKILVAAYREAFVALRRGDDVRMTIDREIVYQRARGPELSPNPRAWITVPGPDEGLGWYGKRRALVELKFRGTAPLWMSEMVSRFGLQPDAFSKYVAAMHHLHGGSR